MIHNPVYFNFKKGMKMIEGLLIALVVLQFGTLMLLRSWARVWMSKHHLEAEESVEYVKVDVMEDAEVEEISKAIKKRLSDQVAERFRSMGMRL